MNDSMQNILNNIKSESLMSGGASNVAQLQRGPQAVADPRGYVGNREAIRSLQDVVLTQSTDFSENRIHSLDQKRLLLQYQQYPTSIYSIQQASQHCQPSCTLG